MLLSIIGLIIIYIPPAPVATATIFTGYVDEWDKGTSSPNKREAAHKFTN
jgi:hypothetical protein